MDAFSRHIADEAKSLYLDHKFLNALELEQTSGRLYLPETNKRSVEAFQRFRKFRKEGLYETIEFESCDDYFFLLRAAAIRMQRVGPRGMMYLAAAVSDFYVRNVPQHKIQSAGGPLNLALSQTPKLLGELRDVWAPDTFCVSFKLETDRSILLLKARR